jgi:hypothetical protein
MTRDKRNIDKLFRSSLKGLREKAPLHAWNKLDHALDAARKSTIMFYYRLAAASVLILLAFGAGFYYAGYVNKPTEFAEIEIPEKSISEITQTENAINTSPNTDHLLNSEPLQPIEVQKNVQPRDTIDPEINRGLHKDYGFADNVQPYQGDEYILHKDDVIQTEDVKPINDINTLAFIKAKEINGHPELSGTNHILFPGNLQHDQYYTTQGLFVDNYDYTPVSRDSKWSIGAQFSPTYSYREISPNYGTNPSGSQDLQDNLNNAEDALFSYAGGLNVDYNFAGDWSLQSGMYYSRIGQVNNDALQFKKNNDELLLYAINTSTGDINVAYERVPENVRKINSPKDTIDIGGISNLKVIQNFDLFEIPFLVKYKLLKKKFSINLSGGLSPAYLLKNSTYLETEDRKYDIGDAGNLNSMIVNTSLGLGLEYLITNQLSINFEPTFKYSLSPINNNSNFSYHPYYFSWFTGIRLKIN